MSMRRLRPHYGNRFGVSAWTPTYALQEVAHGRTEGMVGYFLSTCSRHDPVKWQDQLYILARSCYLQGVNDTVDAAARLRLREQRGEGPK